MRNFGQLIIHYPPPVLVSGQEALTGSGQVHRLDLATNAIQSYGPLASPKDTADFGLFGELLYLP